MPPPQNPLLYPLLLLLLLPPFSSPLPSPPPNPDSAALLSFQSAADPSGLLLHLSSPTKNSSFPQCASPGIACSPQNRVIRLVLQNLGLNGTLPNSSLNSLTQLRILSLKSNALRGRIPNLSSLTNLKALFLSHNLFTGSFPLSLLSLHRLRTLDLSHNSLSGSIPGGLSSLDRLGSLRLDSNRFSGNVPALNMSDLKFLNFSENDLFGPVPVTVTFAFFGADAFEGNERLCGAVVLRECRSNSNFFNIRAGAAPSPGVTVTFGSANANGRKHEKGLIAVGFLVLGVVLVMSLVGVCLVVREKKRKKKKGSGLGVEKNVVFDEVEANGERSAEEVEDRCHEVAAAVTEEKMRRLGRSGSLVFCAGESHVYGLEQLMRASAEMLGRGSLGSTYKAVLDGGLILCVKRLDAGRIGLGGKEGFERHMEVVGRLRHPNLVPLRAFFQAKEERLLVYDYQPNGSLYSLIHGMIGCLFLAFLLLHLLIDALCVED